MFPPLSPANWNINLQNYVIFVFFGKLGDGQVTETEQS
jgi:hypothetical protein